jgi:hypothetical protein
MRRQRAQFTRGLWELICDQTSLAELLLEEVG